MKKWLWIPLIMLACGGCESMTPTDDQKKQLLSLIEQLEQQDRISKTNAEDIKKLLEKE